MPCSCDKVSRKAFAALVDTHPLVFLEEGKVWASPSGGGERKT